MTLPFYDGRTELTAAQLNAFIDAMRRQSRIWAEPPLEAIETPEGWLIRCAATSGFWAILTDEKVAGQYGYVEAMAGEFGDWEPKPDGRTGVAFEANSIGGIPQDTIAWLEPVSGDAGGTATAGFVAPRLLAPLPRPFWAKLTEASDGTYGFIEQFYANGEFCDRDDADAFRAEAGENGAAVEANGQADVPAGTIVLMYWTEGVAGAESEQATPVFALTGSGLGFWVKLTTSNLPTIVEFDLAGLDNAPTGGTFKIRLRSGITGVTFTTPDLPFDVDAITIEEELWAFWGTGVGSVAVTGDDGGPWTITFQNSLAGSFAYTPEIITDGLEYAEGVALNSPAVGDNGIATGKYRSQIARTYHQIGLAGNWIEMDVSPSGTWYPKRDARMSSFDQSIFNNSVINADLLIPTGITGRDLVDGTIVFLERSVNYPSTVGFQTFPLGVDASGLTGGSAQVVANGANAVLTLSATGGTFRVRYNTSAYSAPIAYNATVEEVEAALLASTSSAAGTYVLEGGPLPDNNITVGYGNPTAFQPTAGSYSAWTYDYNNVPDIWYGGKAGTSVEIMPTTLNDVQVVQSYFPGVGGGRPIDGTFTLIYDGEETGPIPYNAYWQDIVDELEALPNIGAGNVTGEGGRLPAPVYLTFGGDLAGQALPEIEIGDTSELVVADGDDPPEFMIGHLQTQVISLEGGNSDEGSVTSFGSTLFKFKGVNGGSVAWSSFPTGRTLAAMFNNSTVAGPGRFRAQNPDSTVPPWSLMMCLDLAQEDQPDLEAVTGSSSSVIPVIEQAESKGETLEPTGGTFRLCFGPQYKIDTAVPCTFSNGSVAFTLNGVSGSFPYNASGTNIAGSFNSIVIPNVFSATGFGSYRPQAITWGGPIGVAPIYLTFYNWPLWLPRTLTVSNSVSSPLTAAAPAAAVKFYRDIWNDAIYYMLAIEGAGGGTWKFTNLASTTYPSPSLAWNATAADVQAAFTGYNYVVSSAGGSLVHYPYTQVTASGGPLDQAPVFIRFPNDWSANIERDYTFQNTSQSMIGSTSAQMVGVPSQIALTATGLTTQAVPAITVESLESDEIDFDATRAEVQDALNATAGGQDLIVYGEDGGTYTFAAPAYDGLAEWATPFDRLTARGSIEGGRLRVRYNAIVPPVYYQTAATTLSDVNFNPSDGVYGTQLYQYQNTTPSPTDNPRLTGFWGRILSTAQFSGIGQTVTTYYWSEVYPRHGLPRNCTEASWDSETQTATGSGSLPAITQASNASDINNIALGYIPLIQVSVRSLVWMDRNSTGGPYFFYGQPSASPSNVFVTGAAVSLSSSDSNPVARGSSAGQLTLPASAFLNPAPDDPVNVNDGIVTIDVVTGIPSGQPISVVPVMTEGGVISGQYSILRAAVTNSESTVTQAGYARNNANQVVLCRGNKAVSGSLATVGPYSLGAETFVPYQGGDTSAAMPAGSQLGIWGRDESFMISWRCDQLGSTGTGTPEPGMIAGFKLNWPSYGTTPYLTPVSPAGYWQDALESVFGAGNVDVYMTYGGDPCGYFVRIYFINGMGRRPVGAPTVIPFGFTPTVSWGEFGTPGLTRSQAIAAATTGSYAGSLQTPLLISPPRPNTPDSFGGPGTFGAAGQVAGVPAASGQLASFWIRDIVNLRGMGIGTLEYGFGASHMGSDFSGTPSAVVSRFMNNAWGYQCQENIGIFAQAGVRNGNYLDYLPFFPPPPPGGYDSGTPGGITTGGASFTFYGGICMAAGTTDRLMFTGTFQTSENPPRTVSVVNGYISTVS